jgi:hypothetical protein
MDSDIVRVRIVRHLTGSVDGIDLRPFQPGVVYDVSTTLGSYLLCVQVAEPAPEDGPPLAMPLTRIPTGAEPVGLKPPFAPDRDRVSSPSARNGRRSRAAKRR